MASSSARFDYHPKPKQKKKKRITQIMMTAATAGPDEPETIIKEYTTGISSRIDHLSFSPSGHLISIISGSQIRVFDTLSGQQKWTQSTYTQSPAFSYDGAKITVGCTSYCRLNFLNANNGEYIQVVNINQNYNNWVYAAAWSCKDIVASSLAADFRIQLLNGQGGIIRNLSGHGNQIHSLSFSKDGTQLASGSQDMSIRLWDTDTGTCVRTITGHTATVCCIAFSPTHPKILASASLDGSVRLWNVTSGECLHTFTGNTFNVKCSLSWGPDGYHLASADGTNLRIWWIDANHPEKCISIKERRNMASAVAFSNSGDQILLGYTDGRLVLCEFHWPLSKGGDIHFGRFPSILSRYLEKLSNSSEDAEHGFFKSLVKVSHQIKLIPDATRKLQDQLSLLHKINNPVFANVDKIASKCIEIDKELVYISNLDQKMNNIATEIHGSALKQAPLESIKNEVNAYISLSASLYELLPIATKILNEYETLVDPPASESGESATESEPSIKPFQHSYLRKMSAERLGEIIKHSLQHSSTIMRLEKQIAGEAEKLSNSLDAYEAECISNKEKNEKNVDELKAFLAYLTADNKDKDKLKQFKGTLTEFQEKTEKAIRMNEDFSKLLDEYSSVHKQLWQIKQNENDLERLQTQYRVHSSTKAQYARMEGSEERLMLESAERMIVKTAEKIKALQDQVKKDAGERPGLDQQLEDIKERIKTVGDMNEHTEIVYTWLDSNVDNTKLDVKDILDLVCTLSIN